MTFSKKMALTLPAPSGKVSDTIDMARQAEALGYTDIWLADAGGQDALTLATLILERTDKLRVGIAVIPVYTRTPAVLASTFAVIAEAFPGRFVPGLGTSSQTIINNWHGLRLEKPVTRIRETMALMRSIMAGEKTNFEGETISSKGYRQPAVEAMPIYLAALRPRMLECAAEVGDGVILNLFPRSALPKIMQHIAVGAERAGKSSTDIEVVCRHVVAVTNDKKAAREAFRATVVGYYATPVYNKFLSWAGYNEVASEIREGWATRDHNRTKAALSDELIDEIALIGTEAECQQLMLDNMQGGIDTNIVSFLHPTAENVEATFQAFSADRFSF